MKPGETAEFEAPVGSNYEVVEDNHFEDGYSQSITGGSGTVGSDTEPVTVTATNTYVENPDITISGEKTWELNGEDVELPESIIVRLKDGNYMVEEKEVTPDGEGRWTYSFTAPKYDADGDEIVYTVEEEPVEGFTATYEGFDIVNTWAGDDTPGSGDEPGDTPETPEDTDDPAEDPSSPGGNGTKTGDESSLGILLALMGFSLAGIGATLVMMKGRKSDR